MAKSKVKRTRGPNTRRHEVSCVMCGKVFLSPRPDSKTDTSSCRSALRRWMATYNYVPAEPPGRYGWLNTAEGRRAARKLKAEQSRGKA